MRETSVEGGMERIGPAGGAPPQFSDRRRKAKATPREPVARKGRVPGHPEAREARPGATPERPFADEKRGPLVLVVDDYRDAREMVAEFLEFQGFRVVQAVDGAEALDRAFEHKPDVVLMDLSLPRLDGWEATRRLKADPRTRHIPIAALTGHALAGHSDGARRAGCDAFITKPCLPEVLLVEIRRLLQSGTDSKVVEDESGLGV